MTPTRNQDRAINLKAVIDLLIQRHQVYGAEGAYSEITIRWKAGRIVLLNENRMISVDDLGDK